jgi:pyrroline-5-carboxylate reductase
MNAKTEKIGFVGAGNMATALIKGIIQSGIYRADHLRASDTNAEATKAISDRFGIICPTSNSDLVRESTVVVLSVKPQNMVEVLEGVKNDVRDDHLVISIAAGIPLKLIRSVLGREVPFIRVMPNTPALVQEGMSALAAGELVTLDQMAIARNIFGAVGETVEVREGLMDAITAVSGSGPGYVFKIMECMVDAGVAVGLESATSRHLVAQTFLGAARMAKESEYPLSRLREMVTSPGGTTAAALAVFEEMGLEDTVRKAIEAACQRSVELGKKG